ncbi:MAG: hypothetical protein Q7T03_10655 [Deltaproteobacteria bacterium]|nr:hypothetical protein [Deltaproteobacteria bacterium]
MGIQINSILANSAFANSNNLSTALQDGLDDHTVATMLALVDSALKVTTGGEFGDHPDGKSIIKWIRDNPSLIKAALFRIPTQFLEHPATRFQQKSAKIIDRRSPIARRKNDNNPMSASFRQAVALVWENPIRNFEKASPYLEKLNPREALQLAMEMMEAGKSRQGILNKHLHTAGKKLVKLSECFPDLFDKTHLRTLIKWASDNHYVALALGNLAKNDPTFFTEHDFSELVRLMPNFPLSFFDFIVAIFGWNTKSLQAFGIGQAFFYLVKIHWNALHRFPTRVQNGIRLNYIAQRALLHLER